jgi:hypothetical protein
MRAGLSRRPLLRALVLGVVLGGLVAACQPAPSGPPPVRQTTTSLDLPSARDLLAERLAAEGFSVEREVGGLRVSSKDPRFMRCDALRVRPLVRDSGQTRLTRPDQTLTTATIRIEAAGPRTRVSWQPRFTGSYLNRLDNIRFDSPCRSTGVLEQLLSTALPN